MLSALLVWTVGHNLLAAGVALAATWALRHRKVSHEAQAAATALRVFWGGLAATAIVQASMVVLADADAGATVAFITVLLAFLTALVALGSLAAYFAYVFSGSRRAILVVALLYLAVAALSVYDTLRAQPTGLTLTRWNYEVAYAAGAGISPAAANQSIISLAALLPALIGAVSFLVIGFRSSGATRARGILVGAALVLWFGSLAIAAPTDAGNLARKLLSMGGFLAVYFAYLPPRALQTRWGLVPIGREDEYERIQTERGEWRKQAQVQRAHRIRELI